MPRPTALRAVLAGKMRPDGGGVERLGTVVVGRLPQDGSRPDLSCTAEAALRSRQPACGAAPELCRACSSNRVPVP